MLWCIHLHSCITESSSCKFMKKPSVKRVQPMAQEAPRIMILKLKGQLKGPL